MGPGLAITHFIKQKRDLLDNELEKGNIGSKTNWPWGRGVQSD